MIYEKLDNLIANTIKDIAHSGNSTETEIIELTKEVYRAIKTEFATVGYNANHIPTNDQEIHLLKDMITKRRKTADIYTNAGEKQRAANELMEAEIIMNLIPDSFKGPSKEDVEKETGCVIKNFLAAKSLTDHCFDGNLMRFTKDIIAKVKEKYPDAENSVIVNKIKSYN